LHSTHRTVLISGGWLSSSSLLCPLGGRRDSGAADSPCRSSSAFLGDAARRGFAVRAARYTL